MPLCEKCLFESVGPKVTEKSLCASISKTFTWPESNCDIVWEDADECVVMLINPRTERLSTAHRAFYKQKRQDGDRLVLWATPIFGNTTQHTRPVGKREFLVRSDEVVLSEDSKGYIYATICEETSGREASAKEVESNRGKTFQVVATRGTNVFQNEAYILRKPAVTDYTPPTKKAGSEQKARRNKPASIFTSPTPARHEEPMSHEAFAKEVGIVRKPRERREAPSSDSDIPRSEGDDLGEFDIGSDKAILDKWGLGSPSSPSVSDDRGHTVVGADWWESVFDDELFGN